MNGEEANGNGNSKRNLNTILLWVTMGMLSFLGWSSWSNSMQLAEIKGSMVGRQEMESKIAEVKVVQTRLDTDLTALKLALAEHGIGGAKGR